jgi:hypothetical protein
MKIIGGSKFLDEELGQEVDSATKRVSASFFVSSLMFYNKK